MATRERLVPPVPSTRNVYAVVMFPSEDETVAGTTGGTMVPNTRLDVGIWSIGEGATQQQSGGVVLAAGASARPVLKTRVKLHQHKHLTNQGTAER